ncbi:hypothetical protein [Paenibacillus fonticola]|uniref:hypothetical protein n=1 Tax=Paenibacillus fonticola TaxID=379896 RepID=UPI0003731942|nr:hypothetical protein [Paenibacillus fonticola]
MKLIINEKELVQQALTEGYIHQKTSKTITCLIKHYYSLGMNRLEVREEIEFFMENHYPHFNSVKWQDTLDRWVKTIEKQHHSLLEITEVVITNKELEHIKSLNSLVHEKLTFVYLVYGKIFNKMNGNDSYWVNTPRSDIFKDAKITANNVKQGLLVNDLMTLGVIEPTLNTKKLSKRVLFAEDQDTAGIIVRDFRNYIYLYLEWRGDKIMSCCSCGILLRQTSNRKKYCSECSKAKQKEWQRNSMKKIRERVFVK